MGVLSQRVVVTRGFRAIGIVVCVAGVVALTGYMNNIDSASLTPTTGAVPDVDCTAASLQAKAPKDTKVVSATVVSDAGNLPEFCQLEGWVETPGNEVGFRLALPVDWNGKFYFQGVGGFGGTFTNMDLGLARKYASATTDMGHKGTTWSDGSWAAISRAKVIDFGYRGTHVAAVATQALTTAYYSTKPQYAYFNGCSGGGRAALVEALRYPSDFDGIIGGAPGFGVALQEARQNLFKWMTAEPDNYVPISKIEMMAKATLAECDARDGLKDGLISDPRLCRFKPESLKCAGPDGPYCLTGPQVETVKRILAGLKTKSGEVVVPGFAIGHEDLPTGWEQSIVGSKPPAVFASEGRVTWTDGAPNGYLFAEPHFRYFFFKDIPNYDWITFDFYRDRSKLEPLAQILDSTDPDLRPFENRNGKLILYHGWSDSMVPPYWTMGYYERVIKAVGGASKAGQFIRLFMVPGMHHCGGGPGPNTFDSLTALENWVERGVAPDRIVASHSTDGKVDRTRPLCPYPQMAKYKGTGSIDEAVNFVCEVPNAR